MQQIGTLATIRRYPVKSLAGETLERAEIEPSGVRGDRLRAFFVRSGHARAGKPYRGKENDRFHLTRELDDARALALERGVELDVRDGERFFDAGTISLLVDRWLDELSEHVGYTVEPERFRPNLFVRADTGFVDGESALSGAILTLGDVRLRVSRPIERCVVPTYDLDGGGSDPRILAFVAQQRNTWMGVYCDVLRAGGVAAGDAVARVDVR